MKGMPQQQKIFKYPEVVDNHYLYHHAVDDHNQKRHTPLSFEETRGTKHWPNQVFAFLLAVTKVNVMLAASNFYNNTYSGMLEFRKAFA